MGSLTIRRLDEDVKQRLRMRAAREGVSMEEAARRIISAGVRGQPGQSIQSFLAPKGTVVPGNIVDAIAAIVGPSGMDFPIPPRPIEEKPFTFDDPEEGDPA